LKRVHYPRHLYYLIIKSEYRKANELAETTRVLAFETGDAASYLSDGANALCQPIYETISDGPDKGLYFFSSIILMHLKIKAPEQTHQRDYSSEVLERLETNPMAIDWVLRFPLQQVLAEHSLANKQWPTGRVLFSPNRDW